MFLLPHNEASIISYKWSLGRCNRSLIFIFEFHSFYYVSVVSQCRLEDVFGDVQDNVWQCITMHNFWSLDIVISVNNKVNRCIGCQNCQIGCRLIILWITGSRNFGIVQCLSLERGWALFDEILRAACLKKVLSFDTIFQSPLPPRAPPPPPPAVE